MSKAKNCPAGFLSDEVCIHREGLRLAREAKAQLDLYESSLARTESRIINSMLEAQVTCIIEGTTVYKLIRGTPGPRLECFEAVPAESVAALRNF